VENGSHDTAIDRQLARRQRTSGQAYRRCSPNLTTPFNSIPASLTYDLPGPTARIAANPVPVAAGGVTLALVLLGLRTVIGAMVGRDHVVTHISGRVIPRPF